MQWANKLFGAGILTPEQERMLSAQQRASMGSASLLDAGIAMLANSGYSQMPTSAGQAIAAGLGAGRASYAGQAQALQQQMAQRQQAQAEAQQRQSILQGLDPEIQRFAAGLSLPQLMDVAKQSAGEKAKAMNRAPSMSSYAKTAVDILGPGSEGTPEFRALVKQLATQSKAPITNVNVPGAASPFDKALATEDAKTFSDWRSKAMAAGDTMQALDSLEQINNLQRGGRVGEAQAVIGQFFGSDAAADREVFNAVAQELVLNQASKLSGVISDRDMLTLQETVPSFGKDPRANKVIIDILRRAADKAIRNFDAAEEYRREKGNISGFRPLISLPTPAPSPVASRVDFSKMSDEDLMRQFQ